MRKVYLGLLALGLAACSGADKVPDVWALKGEASSLTFVTNKNNAVDETHSFTILTGRVTADGQASIRVPLIGIDTLIPTRDERMGTMLFKIKQYPELVVTSTLDMQDLQTIEIGASENRSINTDIALHGQRIRKPIDVVITRSSGNKVRVASARPVVVQAGDFNLEAGVDALRDIAGLKQVSYTVPVSFDLVFVGQ